MKDNCLLVFLNPPVFECMDTALRSALGPEKSVRAYVDMARQVFALGHTLENVQVTAAYLSTPKYPDLRWLDADDPGFLTPRGADESERFMNSMRWPFDAGARRVGMLSVFAPTVPAEWLNNAFSMLGEKHLVLGPAQNGVCYFMGMSGDYSPIFEGYPWAGKNMFEELNERAKRARLSVHTLPEYALLNGEKGAQQIISPKSAAAAAPQAEPKPKAASKNAAQSH